MEGRLMELSEKEIITIVNWWRASNRYDAIEPHKTDEIVKYEMSLIKRLFKEKRAIDNGVVAMIEITNGFQGELGGGKGSYPILKLIEKMKVGKK